MHGLPTHVEVAGDRFRVPPVCMQLDDRSPALRTVLDFCIARIAALGRRWFGTGGQNELDGSRGGLAIEFDEADRCNFMRAEC